MITLAADLGYEVRFSTLPREMLYIADEVFFTGTAAEITPIRSIDRITIGEGTRGPITTVIQQRFFDVISGRVPDTHQWLTFVYDDVGAAGRLRNRGRREPLLTARAVAVSAYAAALAMLARRELSAAQLHERLLRKAYTPDEAETAVTRLRQERAVDDRRTAAMIAPPRRGRLTSRATSSPAADRGGGNRAGGGTRRGRGSVRRRGGRHLCSSAHSTGG